ncbi:MAG: SDR family oxidoreductase [Bacteroidota bacterium]
MKIFITGATGMLGSHIAKALSDRGHTVNVLVRSKEKAENLTFPNINIFEGDITDKQSIDAAMKGCRQVYHLAAFAGVWAPDTGTFYDVNVGGTTNVLQSALENNIEKVVITSTAGNLGPSIHGIITEDKVRDTDILNEYEGSKIMADSRAREFIARHNMNIVFVLPTRVYGPYLLGNHAAVTLVIDKFVNHGWRIYPGRGNETGNFVYIDDVTQGHLLAMEKGIKGESYIIGGENATSITFFELLGELSGIKRKMIRIPIWLQMLFARTQLFLANNFNRKPLITPGWIKKGTYDYEISSDKAVNALGYSVTPLKDGLSKTVEYLKTRK